MSTPRLTAEVTADLTPFQAGMNRLNGIADKEGSKIARTFGNKFGSGMLTGFVLGTVASAITQPLRELPERAKYIDEMATKLNLTTDEFQMVEAAANDANRPVEEFITSITDGNVSLSDAISKLGKYREQVRLTAGEIKTLNDARSAGRALKRGVQSWGAWGLNKGVSATTAAMAAVFDKLGISYNKDAEQDAWESLLGLDGTTAGLEEKLRGKKRDRLTDKLAGLKEDLEASKQTASPNATLLAQSVTSRQQIGAFVGTTPDIVTEARKTNEKLDGIRDEIRRTQEQVREALTNP